MAKKSGAVVSGPPSDADYRAEDDHRTLTRAEEVRQDKKRFGAARKHGLRQVANTHRLYSRASGR